MARESLDCPNTDSKCDFYNQRYLNQKTVEVIVVKQTVKCAFFSTITISVSYNIPTAIVLTISRAPFSRNTVCCLPDWSPSILITSSLVFGEQILENTSNRSTLESIIRPVTSLIGSRKYLWNWLLFFSVRFVGKMVWFRLLVGVNDVFASTGCQYI